MSKRHIEEILFEEKYRPQKMSEMILPERYIKRFEKGFQDLPRILLHSTPGTGKTSLAEVLVKEFKHPFKFINSSSESSVEQLKKDSSLDIWCSNYSVSSKTDLTKIKVVIFDEIDGASPQFYKALRGFMRTHRKVGFIATCNYKSKLPEAVVSRFNIIDFNFTEKDKSELLTKYSTRLAEICIKENLFIHGEALKYLVTTNFPDLRAMVTILQAFKSENVTKISLEDVKNSFSAFSNLFDLVFLQDDPITIYKTILQNYSGKVEHVMSSFFNFFPEFVIKEKAEFKILIPKFILAIADWQVKKANIIDPPLAAIAMIYELQQTVLASLKK